MKKVILICGECDHFITKDSELVDGSPNDPNDKRCPMCGSSTFWCGYCRNEATLLCAKPRVTWNCMGGCNP